MDNVFVEASINFSNRFNVAFRDVKSGSVIDDPKEIYQRLLDFFGSIPFAVENDMLWWTRGTKACQIMNAQYKPEGRYYFGRLECKILSLIPFYDDSTPENSFIYIDCGAMPSLRSDAINRRAQSFESWDIEPLSFYEGRLIDESLASEGRIRSEFGDLVNVLPEKIFRYDRFLTNQNILLVSKASPIVRRESTLIWEKMDDILAKASAPGELVELMATDRCYDMS